MHHSQRLLAELRPNIIARVGPEPVPEDYGTSLEVVAEHERKVRDRKGAPSAFDGCVGLIAFWMLAIFWGLWVFAGSPSEPIPKIPVGILVTGVAIGLYIGLRSLLAGPPRTHPNIVRYKGDLLAWKLEYWKVESELVRRKGEYWIGLTPKRFEEEVGEVFRSTGYQVWETPHTDDKGVDLLLKSPAGSTIVVQCKRWAKPCGPAIVRELYGTMIAHNADEAILVATSGATRGARNFISDKPISVMDLNGILQLAST